ncbi:MAG: LCP family protein [Anaerolineae bacterium]|nr:LCP family protein [Anaerolineae bacterium]
MSDLDALQPIRPIRLTTATPPRRRGCFGSCFAVVLISLLCSGLSCILSLTLYLFFPPAPLDLLVMGIDARPGEGLATRADTIMIVGLQPSSFSVSVLSIPRDVFIDVPGYGLQRINTINVLGEQSDSGGPSLFNAAIERNFAIGIDRYVRLDFQAFIRLIDAVGGITVDVPERVVDYNYPTLDGGTMIVEFQTGPQLMDGQRALIYARTRHQDDDYRRAARQQEVIQALAAKLLNPIYWGPALQVIEQSIDTDLSAWDLLQMLPVIAVRGGRFETRVIDRADLRLSGGVNVPNYDRLRAWIDPRFD